MNHVGTRKESFPILHSLRHFRDVLQPHLITVVTDHMLLLGFMKSPQTNAVLIRSQESLSELDTTIEQLECKENINADALSRIDSHIKI